MPVLTAFVVNDVAKLLLTPRKSFEPVQHSAKKGSSYFAYLAPAEVLGNGLAISLAFPMGWGGGYTVFPLPMVITIGFLKGGGGGG